jgi:hypothetical protein
VILLGKVLTSLVVAMLLFEGMVIAFHLLNMPSDLAFWGGVCLLLFLAAGGIFVLKKIWWRRICRSLVR